jgi:uncharacterized membrane protein
LSLETNKALGGVGAILLAIPFANLIGIILLLIAMKGLADDYNDDDIFRNALYGFIFGFVGVIALVAVIIMLILGFATISPVVTPFAGLGLIILTFFVLYVFSLISAIFYNRSLNILAQKSGEGMFNTAGMVLLIGAIIPVIGVLLQLVAWILAAVGFFSIRPSTQVFIPTPVVSTTQENKFCQHCGAPLPPDATYCTKCGKKVA